jgi:hypothetical protein
LLYQLSYTGLLQKKFAVADKTRILTTRQRKRKPRAAHSRKHLFQAVSPAKAKNFIDAQKRQTVG